MIARASLVILLPLLLNACSITLQDNTDDTLFYAPPSNTQSFKATTQSQSPIDVERVNVNIANVGSFAMDSVGNARWQAKISIPECTSIVSYYFHTYYRNTELDIALGPSRFPQIGHYFRTIEDIPTHCLGADLNQVFRVNTAKDLPDINPGDGICSTEAEGYCSLRAAIMEANAREGIDLIELPPGRYPLTQIKPDGTELDHIPEDQWGDLDITDTLALVGLVDDEIHLGHFIKTTPTNNDNNGRIDFLHIDSLDNTAGDSLFAKIDGRSQTRILQVHGNNTGDQHVLLKNIALINGYGENQLGAGILNEGNLRLERVAIYDHILQSSTSIDDIDNPASQGAGIANLGKLFATETAILFNQFVNNDNQYFSSTAYGRGSALWIAAGGEALIENSLISGNRAYDGSAIEIEGSNQAQGKLRMTNTTVSHNIQRRRFPLVDEEQNYAIFNDGGDVVLNFVSLVANNKGGITSSPSSSTIIMNSLMIRNDSINLPFQYDCSGPFTSLGGNIMRLRAPTCQVSNPQTNDTLSSVVEGPAFNLVYRGGFTYVPEAISLSANELNIYDNIEQTFSQPFGDQRGLDYTRAVDFDQDGTAQMDAGAYEHNPISP